MSKRKPFNLAQAQKDANEFALDYLRNKPLGIPAGLSDEDHDAVMRIVHRTLVEGWAAGFMKGVGQ